ncbi:MAG: hypothetical protein AB7U73_03225 [Pirellulales bacterium]
MVRPIVSLLLLPCVLLAQSAFVLGHAHVDLGHSGHGSRVHFHFGHSHFHHEHAGHRHGHHDLVHDRGTGDPPALPNHPSESPGGHDSDAVYLDGIDAIAKQHQSVEPQRSALCFGTAGDASLLEERAGGAVERVACQTHGPPSDRPIYLLHSALLI